MTDRHILTAFLATLIAIVVLVVTGAIIAINGYGTEALGIGGAVTGLIGVIGTFRPRPMASDGPTDVNVTNPASDPVPVESKAT